MTTQRADSGPRIVLLMGLPASGKSTFAASMSIPVVTLDGIREGGDSRTQLLAARARAEGILRSGGAVVVDACNVLPQHRASWSSLAGEYQAHRELVVVESSLDVCLARNAARGGGAVPESVIRRYAAEWPLAMRKVRSEGWSVSVVSGEPVASRRW